MEGFSIRKDFVNRSKVTGLVVSRRYTCHRQGHGPTIKKRDASANKTRKETRTGCLAHMTITRQPNGKFRVIHFETRHNHEFVTPLTAHLLPSQKRISFVEAVEADTNPVPDGVPKKKHELMLAETKDDDVYDSVDREMSLESKRTRDLNRDEAEMFRNYFRSKKLKDPSFVYCVQLDADEEMTNFFWADEKMLADYVNFGDVVCFDTTYLKNKDCRPLIHFFGINNHKQILVFGAAFLYDDTVQTFKWLFRTFLKTMSGKTPKTILSDKDAVISNAIVSEFPEAQRRLCVWQTYQNALKHLNQVVASSASFTSDLCSCFFNPDEEGFVNSWKFMLDTYGLWENEWLHGIFEERDKWALPFSKHIFSADIETALLSEISFTSLRKYLKLESHVLQYVKHFGRVVNDYRYKELEANYDMGQQMPRLMGDVIMLKRVRLVYTPVIFKAFQHEYENCLNIVVNQCVETVNSVEYKVSTYGQVRQYTVLCSSEDDSVACSCMKFESVGILCSHALKVLDYSNIKIVPSQYMLKRWTRDARA
ncbi:protein far1-related sequence 5 [Phtheirospermum japonicum]|uniref:Protein FAR1-RELATED SEQUENCE n=1 Tax=Phtheirospermum japonicum TaxID=374723 RepID=A0A830BBA1_9LAMI|nr:protein far1-related sequence 5 [Phtheirospermum japonicum]